MSEEDETEAAGCCRTRMSITRSVSVSDDGVTTTEVHITEVRRTVDAGDAVGVARDRAGATGAGDAAGATGDGASSAVAVAGDMRGRSGGCGCDCFDVDASCDEREKAMIAAIRAYLRPTQAPECLMAKLNAVLDRCCRE